MGNTLNVRDLIVTGLIALAATLVLTPLVHAMARRVGLLAKPGPRRLHKRPMPTGGGLAIFLGFWLSTIVVHGWSQSLTGLLIASTLMVVLGVIDDYVDLRPGVKLLGQLAAAAVLVYSGTRIEVVGHPLGGAIELGWLSVPVTLLWLVAVTNVLNIIDGLDGLAAGIASIAAMPLLVIAFQRGEWTVALLAAALIGSTVGFLRYNFNPARVFMGDTGGLFLGFVLGAFAVEGALGGASGIAVSIPVLVLGVPVFDTICAVIRRAANGRPIAQADDGHLHHQLLKAGLSQRQAVLLLYSVGGLLALVGIALLKFNVTTLQAFLVALGLGVAALPWARRLGVFGERPPTSAVQAGSRPGPVPGRQQGSEKI